MIDQTTLDCTYVAIVLGFVFLPGPATLLTVTRAASSGATRVGIATGSGIATGDIVHTFMAIVGISAIIAASATLFGLDQICGGGLSDLSSDIRAILEKAPIDFVRRYAADLRCHGLSARRFSPRFSIPRRRCSFSPSCRSSCGPRTRLGRAATFDGSRRTLYVAARPDQHRRLCGRRRTPRRFPPPQPRPC